MKISHHAIIFILEYENVHGHVPIGNTVVLCLILKITHNILYIISTLYVWLQKNLVVVSIGNARLTSGLKPADCTHRFKQTNMHAGRLFPYPVQTGCCAR